MTDTNSQQAQPIKSDVTVGAYADIVKFPGTVSESKDDTNVATGGVENKTNVADQEAKPTQSDKILISIHSKDYDVVPPDSVNSILPADLEKMTRGIEDKNAKFIKEFDLEVYMLKRAGNALREATALRESKSYHTAVGGLAAIFAVYHKYFHLKDATETAPLMKNLREQAEMKGANKKTTVLHLLSRVYRGSDDQQCSSDAKILKIALEEGIAANGFRAWVDGIKGGLKKIKAGHKDADIKAAEQKKKDAAQQKANKIEKEELDARDPKILNQRLINAMKAFTVIKPARHIFDVISDDAKANLKELFSDGVTAVPFVVKIDEDGDYVFYALTDKQLDDESEDESVNASNEEADKAEDQPA